MTTSLDHRTIRILKRLVCLHLHRIKTYRHFLAAGQALDPALHILFNEMIACSEIFADELSKEIQTLEISPLAEQTATVATGNRFLRSLAWTQKNSKTSLVIMLCKLIEGHLIKSYERAFASYTLSLPVRRLVVRHERALLGQVAAIMAYRTT
jgi:hypothetical protein